MSRSRYALILSSAIMAGILSSYFFIGLLTPGGTGGLRNLPAGGNVEAVGVGIYWDAGCNDTVSFLDWGVVEPGSSENVTIYVRNEGNSGMVLSFNTSNWNPPDSSQHITISWDYDGRKIQPGEVIQVRLTITISATIDDIKTFTYNIQVKGTS